jgi:formate dehydrogenase
MFLFKCARWSNTARGKICDRDAVVRALESGQLAG